MFPSNVDAVSQTSNLVSTGASVFVKSYSLQLLCPLLYSLHDNAYLYAAEKYILIWDVNRVSLIVWDWYVHHVSIWETATKSYNQMH